jgi:hypothetical protein
MNCLHVRVQTPSKGHFLVFSLFKIYRIDIENRYVSADISVSRYGAKISIIDIPNEKLLQTKTSAFYCKTANWNLKQTTSTLKNMVAKLLSLSLIFQFFSRVRVIEGMVASPCRNSPQGCVRAVTYKQWWHLADFLKN